MPTLFVNSKSVAHGATVNQTSQMIKKEDGIYNTFEGWTDWRDFRIAKKIPESSEITSFYLEPVDNTRLPPFLPGQYISVLVDVPKFKYKQPRQYSLSDAPNPTYYRISVKKEAGVDGEKFEPGWISNILHADKNEGDIIQVSHPAGEFFCDVDKTVGPVVLMSAGVGLTPMVSILNTIVQRKQTDRKVSFIHAVRSSEVQAFANHVQDIIKQDPNVTATVFNKSPREGAIEGADYKFKSRMTLDVLDKEKDLFLNNTTSSYYICGPDAFMADMSKKLQEHGVEVERIHTEVFGTGLR